ncbi:MAG: hypothetical protein MR425_06775 [Lachnospiraceae bacterium]|nr:hypothetical protein [Lachnospiraceae bacterium]
MGRYYHLSKKVTDNESKEIAKELQSLDDVASVEITEDHEYIKIVTRDDQFADVMGNAVNICSRIAKGVELSFARFAFE